MEDGDPIARFAAARADRALVVVEGFHAIKHALRFGAQLELVVTDAPDELAALADALAPDVAADLARRAATVTPDAYRDLGPRAHHTRVAAIARRPPFDPAAALAARPDAPAVLLDDPRHLGNLGAVVRVAAGADAACVLTVGDTDPWDPTAVRGSAGLHFALPVGRLAEGPPEGARGGSPPAGARDGPPPAGARDGLPPHGARDGLPPRGARGGRPLVALDPDGDEIPLATLPAGALYAFGSERHGLGDELLAAADVRLRIPMRAGVSSLNLATSVAAVLFARPLARAG